MMTAGLPTRVLVCCGSGGVGKTTVAAALGLAFARAGHRAVVLTIDPARRLGEALGIEALADSPRLVRSEGSGELWAATLEPSAVFDRLVATLAPSVGLRETIRRNRLYQELSTALAGSRELIALERVFELASDPRFDVVVLDTPPAQHALDFLDAPARIATLLDGSLMRWFTQSMPLTPFSLLRDSSALAFKAIEKLTGLQVFADLSAFLRLFSSLFEGFRARAAVVQTLLRGPSSAFVLVATPSDAALRQARAFELRLAEEGYTIAALLANRMSCVDADAAVSPAKPVFTLDDRRLIDSASFVPDLERRLQAVYEAQQRRRAQELSFLEALRVLALPLVPLPQLGGDVGQPADLEALARALDPLMDQLP
jgi:anion-transporting  ArsA/GET3 family ATPase